MSEILNLLSCRTNAPGWNSCLGAADISIWCMLSLTRGENGLSSFPLLREQVNTSKKFDSCNQLLVFPQAERIV
uniref:Adenosine deaminase tRNA specific 2 n=1 Tax=Molossus molossus TaxID=27622 RepID=A0A7J8GP06_MOLMO|nr:adenosine deaminase tRNA specific 2 [Molossus molossus]